MMVFVALLPSLLAGSVYINGVRADLLPEVTLNDATVRFDAQGNIWIDAPGYRVEVLPPTEYAGARSPTSTAPVPTPAPAATAQPVSGASAPRVPLATWWLVSEDNGSAGQALDVVVNGTLAKRVSSGEPQIILDLAPWLRPGANTVVITPVPNGAQGGGALVLYAGRGANLSGTIHLDNPDVVYTRRAADGGGARQFTLTVP